MAEQLRHWRTISEAGPGSIPSAGCSEMEPDCEIFAPVPDAALNGCELHVKTDFNFFLLNADNIV